MKNRLPRQAQDSKKVIQFINDGFSDYLSARVLLNNELLLQGVVLASTAIEKYFKAIVLIYGNENKGHLKQAHFNAIKNIDPKLYESLDEEFLMLLQKCYQLRYTDALEEGFNVLIYQNELLAELDFTISQICKSFKVFSSSGDEVELGYGSYFSREDKRLFENNYLINNISKLDFISSAQKIIGLRVVLGSTFEVSAHTMPVKPDGGFMRVGFPSPDIS